MFLIDKSGSMEGAIEQSKEALSRSWPGSRRTRCTSPASTRMGTVLKPEGADPRRRCSTCCGGSHAAGGTMHGAAVRALHRRGRARPDGGEAGGDRGRRRGGRGRRTAGQHLPGVRLSGGRAGADLCRGEHGPRNHGAGLRPVAGRVVHRSGRRAVRRSLPGAARSAGAAGGTSPAFRSGGTADQLGGQGSCRRRCWPPDGRPEARP